MELLLSHSICFQHTIKDEDEIMVKYKISNVPITNGEGALVSIINRDLRFESDQNKKIKNPMTKDNLIMAPMGTTLEEAQEILKKYRIEKLPIVDSDFKLKGLITIKEIEEKIKYLNDAKDSNEKLLDGAAVGIASNTIERVKALVDANVDIIVLDTAHGHSKNVLTWVEKIKAEYPGLQLIPGSR